MFLHIRLITSILPSGAMSQIPRPKNQLIVLRKAENYKDKFSKGWIAHKAENMAKKIVRWIFAYVALAQVPPHPFLAIFSHLDSN